ncbi:aldose epimerase family protein [Pedobacter sp. MC2016-24]|uniref:aldose epimerase family protein n=1 Tax=Pedobacter sp. MC2016-24 TaxID=2780090 RepID=UPI00187E8998|nr:aldose epimerase family protein [Pedobacter sp. MC2016-24]MBE9598501.1 galactose mutarotase [Pedobacter sp. MC2016-24]
MNKKFNSICLASVLLWALSGCDNVSNKSAVKGDSVVLSTSKIPDSAGFKNRVKGKEVSLFVLKNKNGAEAAITNYGGRLVSLLVPDNKNEFKDVVLGYDSLKSYQKKGEPFFGALIGRYGNRIAKGKFSLEGKAYQLQLNDGINTLHGGFDGFFAQVWDAKKINEQTLELSYLSKDNEAGYPGNLQVKVTYNLTDDNSLKISYEATTDKSTVLNLTNHAYFNLNGAGDATITDHLLTIDADGYTPVDSTLIPTGKIEPVAGTPFDFSKATLIGARIDAVNEQLKFGKGYDHNFVLRKGTGLRKAATVVSTKTGIAMDVLTEEPGLQFYSGNFMTGQDHDGKGGVSYPHRSAFCLETQHFPDSPNQAAFPSTVLKPGQTYKTNTVYKFYIQK